MRALQMATIDPATFLNLDEELGGIAPGRRATFNVLPEIGEWRPERVFVDGQKSPATAGSPSRAGASTGRRVRRSSPRRPRPSPRSPESPVARYESAVINRRHDSDVHETQAALVARDGSLDHARASSRTSCPGVAGFATTATTSLELLVLGTDPDAMARAAAKVVEMGGGFAFDGGWSAPLEIDGLIAAGGYDRALRIERELTEAHARRRLPVPRSALQPPVRLRRLPARAAAHADRRARGQDAHRCTIAEPVAEEIHGGDVHRG